MYKLKMTEEFGRGLYASYTIIMGETICRCEVLVLSEEDTKRVDATDLKYYVFKYDDSRDCLVLGDGEIFNHSDSPNVSYTLEDFDGRKVMMFRALDTISEGEQLFTNYNQDVNVDIESYKSKESLL